MGFTKTILKWRMATSLGRIS